MSQTCTAVHGTGKTGKDKDKKDKQDLSDLEQEVYGLHEDEHTTNTERVRRVYPALLQRSPRMSGVLLACTFMRRNPRTILCMHKNPDAPSECPRMKNVDPARSTNE